MGMLIIIVLIDVIKHLSPPASPLSGPEASAALEPWKPLGLLILVFLLFFLQQDHVLQTGVGLNCVLVSVQLHINTHFYSRFYFCQLSSFSGAFSFK